MRGANLAPLFFYMNKLTLKQLLIRHVGPVDLTVNAGEIVCLSGGSGTGKSLLLRAIADMLPHDGDCCLGEECASQLCAPVWRTRVALLPAESAWWFETVQAHFNTQDDALLNALGFETSTWQWEIARCSSGERQRLGLLRCLSNQPQCLLLDEPTGNLDPDNTERVEAVIKDYAAQHKAPVLWVSHSVEQIKRIATQHYRLREGKLVEQ